MILIGVLSISIKFILLPGLDPDGLATKLLEVSLLPYFYQFLLGFTCLPLFFVLGRKNSIFSLIFTGIFCLMLASLFPDASSIFTLLGLSVLPIGIGLVPVNIIRGLDVSYGLYIYHMLIVNTLIALGGGCKIFRKFFDIYLFLFYTFACSSVLVSD